MATYIIGQTKTITWSSDNLPNVSGTDQIMIELSIAGDTEANYTIISTQDNTGTYSWLVPNSPTIVGYIRISAIDNDTLLRDPDRSLTFGPFSISLTNVIARVGGFKNRFSFSF
jgi:hypothetical protein